MVQSQLLFPFRLARLSTTQQRSGTKVGARHIHHPTETKLEKALKAAEEFFLDPEAEKSSPQRTHTQAARQRRGKMISLCSRGKSCEDFYPPKKKHLSCMCVWMPKENFPNSIYFANFFHIKKLSSSSTPTECLIARAWNGITNICVCVVVLLLWR